MKLFTIDKDKKFVEFKEKEFKEENKEIDLEELLEKNPEYFFDNSKILIIGRQVATNLNTYIDLLGVDQAGNTVVIELKRHKTPRETLSQLIEYASFIDNLDYNQLNEIFQKYSGEESTLEEYHQEYYKNELNQEKVSWKEKLKLVIVASAITPEIKQSALYLRKNGLNVYCVEFKYFSDATNSKVISSDFVVGENEYLKTPVIVNSNLPKIDKDKFSQSLDENGKAVFEKIYQFAEQENLIFRWGSKGYSLNKTVGSGFVGLCFGYPPDSVHKQCIYARIETIRKKINNSESIVDAYRRNLIELGTFKETKNNLKWVINEKVSNGTLEKFFMTLKQVIILIEKNGLKN